MKRDEELLQELFDFFVFHCKQPIPRALQKKSLSGPHLLFGQSCWQGPTYPGKDAQALQPTQVRSHWNGSASTPNHAAKVLRSSNRPTH